MRSAEAMGKNRAGRSLKVGWVACWVLVGWAAYACSFSKDADEPAPEAKAGAAGAAEAGRGQTGGAASGGVLPVAGTHGFAGSSDSPEDPEPDGPDVLTVAHGVVDADAIAVCFRAVKSGMARKAVSRPRVFNYADHEVFSKTGNLSWSEDDIQALVFVGDLSLLEGLDCEEATQLFDELKEGVESERTPTTEPVAGGAGGAASGEAAAQAGASGAAAEASGAAGSAAASSSGAGGDAGAAGSAGAGGGGVELPLWQFGLPALPAGTLSRMRSYLLVVTGCASPPAAGVSVAGLPFAKGELANAEREALCGPGADGRANLSVVFAPVSRLATAFRVSVQVMHASRATSAVDIVSTPPTTANPSRTLAREVVYGEVQPRVPTLQDTVSSLGILGGDYTLLVRGETSSLELRWNQVLASSELSTVEDGESYVLVLFGPQAGKSPPEGYESFALRLLNTAPEP